MSEPKLQTAKPFAISKAVVFEAYQKVKANDGAAGIDGESISEFEKNLKKNLYKLWNRMSSGVLFPSASSWRRDTEKGRRIENFRRAYRSRQNCPNRGQDVLGAGSGTNISL